MVKHCCQVTYTVRVTQAIQYLFLFQINCELHSPQGKSMLIYILT